jgi:hypothetical protein
MKWNSRPGTAGVPPAPWRRLPVCCIAGCQPASISAISRAADWQSAKRQVSNLRYELNDNALSLA